MSCLKGMSFCACFRLEMQELRERQKEEEVLALKRSMEGGMVSVLFEISLLPLMCLLAEILCDYNLMAGTSYERASSAKGRNGVLIQNWGHGGTKSLLFFSFLWIILGFILFSFIVDIMFSDYSYNTLRVQLLYREGWIQMFLCDR